MNSARIALSLAVLAAAAPALAAPPAPVPPPVPAAANVSDYACVVRTMYMAGAAQDAAKKATDQAAKDQALNISSEAYEAASYLIGKLTGNRSVTPTKAIFDREVEAISKMDQELLSRQIATCIARAKTERAAFIAPMSS